MIRADHELLVAQRVTLEHAGVQVQRHGRSRRKVRVPREDPGSVEPRADRVTMQDPPDRGGRDGGHHGPKHQFPGQLRAAPTRQGHPAGGGQFTGELFDLGQHQRGKGSGSARAFAVSEAVHTPLEEPLAPLDHRVQRHLKPLGDTRVLLAVGRSQDDASPDDHALLGGTPPNQRLQMLPVLVAQVDYERASPRHHAPACAMRPPSGLPPSATLDYTRVVPQTTT